MIFHKYKLNFILKVATFEKKQIVKSRNCPVRNETYGHLIYPSRWGQTKVQER